jgi:hypothetical protein
MYDWFNRGQWDKCFAMIDPKLQDESKVIFPTYASGLQTFKDAYGSVNPWYTRINLHLDASSSKHDKRPFAYVYIVWQDPARGFHMFRERWVKHAGHWYTRVVGLVPNREAVRGQE